MDAYTPMDPRHLPEGLSMNRFRQWCVSRTLRDFRLSVHRGRVISLPNLLRLLHRRWMHGPDEPPMAERPVGLTAPWADAYQPPDLAAARRQLREVYGQYARLRR